MSRFFPIRWKNRILFGCHLQHITVQKNKIIQLDIEISSDDKNIRLADGYFGRSESLIKCFDSSTNL